MECCENKNKGEKMSTIEIEPKKAVLWGVIGLLVLVLVYVTFFQDTVTSSNLAATTGKAASRYSGMVGGC